MADLDLRALSALLGREVNDGVLRTLELVCEEQGKLTPTNGGVLVGCPHPEMFLPFAWVQCARFRGPGKRNITDQADIYGPLPMAVESVMKFLRSNAFLSADFHVGPRRREDVWSIPLEPLKELVVNALVHSSYANHGTAIKVAFLDEQIWIESPGGLIPGMTVEMMTQGVSLIRNPVLARVFKELSLIERWGTGVPEVIAALEDAGLPALEIEEGIERLRITVHIQNHDPMKFRVEESANVRRPGDEQLVIKNGAHVSRYAIAVLCVAEAAPAHRKDLLAATGLSESSNNYRRHILPLVTAGLLRLSIPDKPRSPNQRYLITDAGREFLAAHRQE
jgi:predicted HTH transcriptional regulator